MADQSDQPGLAASMAEPEIRFRQATKNDVPTLLWLIQVRQVMVKDVCFY